MIEVNNKLLEWREFYGYKQKQVAEAIGVNRATYANYECGRRSPDILQSKWAFHRSNIYLENLGL